MFESLLQITNEILTATIVVIAASFLLYNLTRNLSNRVARTSSIVLACVTWAYMCDVFLSLNPDLETYAITQRLQWIAIAFMPAATFHLSDALLATTGLISRGRRRFAVRILYLISTIFVLVAAFSNVLVEPVVAGSFTSMQARALFPLYLIHFIITNLVAFINVQRARVRCLTRSTERRMAYLQAGILMPSLGTFPYAVMLNPGDEFSLLGILLVNLANIIVVFMLLFLSYPLSFFGSTQPDRVIRVELLKFFLRGPGTGLLALVVILFSMQATRIVGLRGEDFMPFAVVAMVMLWQWMISLSLPTLQRILIYRDDDLQQLARLEDLSDRLLTRYDLLQLIEATLETACDYLRVEVAFVATVLEQRLEIIQSVGLLQITDDSLQQDQDTLIQQLNQTAENGELPVQRWNAYWILPLYSQRTTDESVRPIGFMGIEAQSDVLEIEPEAREMLIKLTQRAEQTLDDMILQGEITAALEGLLPQIMMTRTRAGELEYRPDPRRKPIIVERKLPDRDEAFEQVRAALRHYWGGAGISHSRLLEWVIVKQELGDDTENPIHALRNVLKQAIEKQRPEGEQNLNNPEWLLYNILQMRYLEQRKVRYVARRLVMSEADLYRKQNTAIAAVTDTLLKMEYDALQNSTSIPV